MKSIRGISSLEILAAGAARSCWRESIASSNIDATLIAEAPKIGPHSRGDAREDCAGARHFEVDRVGIKATTNEGMGAIGRGEGMAAMAVASVEEIATPA